MEDPSHAIVNALKPFLLNQLTDYERVPRTVLDSWDETAQQAEGSSTARIFLDSGGFGAWFAYILAKNAISVQATFRGKAEFSRLIAKLDEETVEIRQLLASSVASAIEPQVREKIDTVYNRKILQPRNDRMSLGQNKRQRTTDVDSLLPSSPNIRDTTATPSGVTTDLPGNHSAPVERVPVFSSHDTDNIAEAANNIVEDTHYIADDKYVNIDASLAVTTQLLPRELSNSIKRVPHSRNPNILVAAISMIYTNSLEHMDKYGCQMALQVTPEKVTHLAQVLFGAHTETRGGLRYVYMASGAKILPKPEMTLQGCSLDVVHPFFGPELSHAVTHSPQYQEDNTEWRDRTDCVSMVISHRADEGAIIYVSLELFSGTVIAKKLYAKY